MAQQVIGFVGAGNMAASLVGGMIAKGIRPARIWMSDVSEQRLTDLARQHRVHVTARNEEIAERCDVLVLAVKPQLMAEVCAGLKAQFGDRTPLIVSIAAGVTVDNLRSWLGDVPVIRTMPNTPALVQAGATGLYAGAGVTEEHRQLASQIMASVGLTFWFEQESELDAVTAVSGSGPAYFFLLMEAMIEAGEQLGLSSHTARQLVLQTAWGAAQLAITSEQAPAALREQVTSPGGTTAAALDVFEKAGLRKLVDDALTAARDRARELAK